MTNNELAYRLALIALMREFEKVCDAGNKIATRNKAYRDAYQLVEVRSETTPTV
jgi:hypothetical protein